MVLIRPVQEQDFKSIWQIANMTGVGFSSLQPDRDMVRKKFNSVLKSFDAREPLTEAYYLFVMEDSNGEIIGITGIESVVGLSTPWYNYKVNTQVHVSRELNVNKQMQTLTLCSDYAGHSELCSLFLKPEFRVRFNGHLLSKSRFLFMAANRGCFREKIMAELRGTFTEEGVSPFWEALGRHFFEVDFEDADLQVAYGKSFIAKLLPHHPIYTNLLSREAQNVIGQTHKATIPARKLLESEGFRYSGYIDIFDGGPCLDIEIDDIRSIRESRNYQINIHENITADESLWMLGNNRFDDFRCVMGNVCFEGFERVNITREQAEALKVEDGDEVRLVPLFNPSRTDRS